MCNFVDFYWKLFYWIIWNTINKNDAKKKKNNVEQFCKNPKTATGVNAITGVKGE